MAALHEGISERVDTACGICRRVVLVGERLMPFSDVRTDNVVMVCELCRSRARERGWQSAGESQQARGGRRLRVEPLPPRPVGVATGATSSDRAVELPQKRILERAQGARDGATDARAASPVITERLRRQDLELAQLRRELDPQRRADDQRLIEQQSDEIRQLRATIAQRDRNIERLQYARSVESSSMRVIGCALDAFNQSTELVRMARIARTLGEPIINVHDEGPGLPRRVRLTLAWDIAWYEFVVKLDLGAGRASVHETGAGGDSSVLQSERRRSNARWRESGIVL